MDSMRWIRFCRGWVAFEAEGGLPERMLNLVRDRPIELWRLRRSETGLRACCYVRDYRRLRPAARRTGMRLRHTEKHGLPFWLHRYRARLGLPVGMLLAGLLLWLLSGRIWMVTVTGASAPLDRKLCDTLAPLGVAVGAPRSALQPAELQLRALRELPEITWLSVNMKGCVAEICVTERKVGEPEPQTVRASNLVAARDGVIVRTEVLSGQGTVRVGEGVTAGTLLVSGVVETKVGTLLRRAEGTVWADTERTLSAQVPLERTRLLPTGERVTQTELRFFGLRIPLSAALPGDARDRLVEEEFPLRAGEAVLPCGLLRRTYYRMAETPVSLTPAEAETLARRLLAEREEAELAGVTVRTRTECMAEENGAVTLTVRYACTENIAVEQVLWAEAAASAAPGREPCSLP